MYFLMLTQIPFLEFVTIIEFEFRCKKRIKLIKELYFQQYSEAWLEHGIF